MNKTDRDNWRKFLGIKDPQTALDAARIGGDIGKTAGRAGGSVGGGSFEGENPPDGNEEEGAEKGDGAGNASNKIKVGDELDRLEDLYDCETGEKVTIDGLGDKSSEQFPTGFQDCKSDKPPTMADLEGKIIFITTANDYGRIGKDGASYDLNESGFLSYKSASINWANSKSTGGCSASISESEFLLVATPLGGNGCNPVAQNYYSEINLAKSASTASKQQYIDNWKGSVWPAVDRNHLTWNKDKGCFEPLCPELNTAVSDKFKDCEKERILCDKDGNKVKVEVDGNGVKITQAKYNQTSEFRNGKVTAVKKLTESQTEAEFK